MVGLSGCVACHNPLDAEGNCPICDAPTLEDKVIEALLDYLDDPKWGLSPNKYIRLRSFFNRRGKERKEMRDNIAFEMNSFKWDTERELREANKNLQMKLDKIKKVIGDNE